MNDPPSQTDIWRLERDRELAIRRCERLASKLQVAEVAIRQLSRSSGRNFDRLIAAERRAEIAEAALASSSSRPARVAALLLRCLRLLAGIRLCPTCGLRDDHRYNCRTDRLLKALDAELAPQIDAARDRQDRKLMARMDWNARQK